MKTTTRKLLGARIKELRKARRLSQDDLSEKVDIDPKHLSRIEEAKAILLLIQWKSLLRHWALR